MTDPAGGISGHRETPAALILAAGRGSRLMQHTRDLPKCLLRIGDHTIIEHQIRALFLAGIRTIQVITGYRDDLVAEVCGDRVTYAHNPDYNTTNSFDSFGCATIEPPDAGLLVLNSDVLFHPGLLLRLLADPVENVLLADFRSELAEEEMKISVDETYRITAISKSMDPAEAQAENLGVLRLGPAAAHRMLALSRTGKLREARIAWVPDGIHHLRNEFHFRAVSVNGFPWTEIDFPEDLVRAREQVYPLLHEALWGSAASVGRPLNASGA
jgi:L-glutamine-phosphate cytidylyltransferase